MSERFSFNVTSPEEDFLVSSVSSVGASVSSVVGSVSSMATVTAHLICCSPQVTTILVLPLPTAVRLPFSSTVTTFSSSEV